ncbi:MAG TPA: diguanylate cyclase [Thermodesulfovibrionales bacterium]|nr:diguanylate cyclase [Thermodesulfovibrionales bacterium]
MAKAKILVVEDSKPQADVTKEFLEKNGYEVIWAKDGTSAIKAAKTTDLDVILLDLILPDISGNEVCRWLKINTETKGIPIIMLTVKSSLQDKVTSIEAGADEYLPKPYNEVELNAVIYAALRTKALQDELRQRNRQMEELLVKVELLAITDPLTGLYNRRHFETVLKKEMKESKRYNRPVTCLMIDVDHFKRINDSYGHEAGDLVLREVAQSLKQSMREVDTVARWGGEEFIAVMPSTNKEKAVEPASRILRTISQKSFEQIPGETVTVSIGISSADGNIQSLEELLRGADSALYEAKRTGRNRIAFAPTDKMPDSQ